MKEKYSIKDIKNTKTAIRCPSQEIFDKVLQIIEDNGGKKGRIVSRNWGRYKTTTCLGLQDISRELNTFGSEGIGYDDRWYIIDADQLIEYSNEISYNLF